MRKLLFLCHRIPYPPNKGDKIRSFHFLQDLSRHYSVALGTFVDDPDDVRHIEVLRKYCTEVFTITLRPSWQRVRSLYGLLNGQALSVQYYASMAFRRWVRHILREFSPDVVFAFSSTMGQYLDEVKPGTKRVIDYVDVDSEKWRVYGAAKPWPLGTLYRREWRRLGEFERSLVRRVDRCIFVSAPEAELFQTQLDAPASNVSFVNNGVDLQHFDPALDYPNPYPPGAPICVFTGAMDYWANVDAVDWFAKAVFPLVKARIADLEFWIVGARPTPAVRVLAAIAGIHVTGSVPDVRPYLRHATLAVAPMRIARGIQNKVLEAMAMDTPVIGTHAAFEGLAPPPSYAPQRVDDAQEFARYCETMLGDADTYRLRLGGRDYLKESHDWPTSMEQLRNLMLA